MGIVFVYYLGGFSGIKIKIVCSLRLLLLLCVKFVLWQKILTWTIFQNYGKNVMTNRSGYYLPWERIFWLKENRIPSVSERRIPTSSVSSRILSYPHHDIFWWKSLLMKAKIWFFKKCLMVLLKLIGFKINRQGCLQGYLFSWKIIYSRPLILKIPFSQLG